MGRQVSSLLAFNRGLVDKRGLARIDLKRMAMSAAQQKNWMTRVLGSMSLRPGLGYLGSIYQNLACRFLPFVFATDDTALVELTTGNMRVWVNDVVITRPSVATTINNGAFNSDISGWTVSSVTWVSPGYAQFLSDGVTAASAYQLVTPSAADTNKVHALKITVVRGPLTFRVGLTAGSEEYFASATLATGNHSLAFTPAGPFYVYFETLKDRIVWLDQCVVEAAGAMVVPTNWTASDLNQVRKDQSADVLFVACKNQRQQRIERRANNSWSVVNYLAEDGPYMTENVSVITMAPSVLSGNGTLTASSNYFRSNNVGSIFSVTSIGQIVTKVIPAQNTFTDGIKVTGVGVSRAITIDITGVFVGTLSLQKSTVSITGPWSDVSGQTWTAPVAAGSYNDGLDNQIVWYRIGIKTGNYTSGSATATLTYAFGSIVGVGRVTAYISPTVVSIEVLTHFGGTTASPTWAEGQWSDRRGWPTGVALYEGRLWWSGKNGFWGSISDAYDSLDPAFVGDAGPINRGIGSGPVDVINWILPLQRLVLGAQGAEFSVRSSALDEPLTPTNVNIKASSTQGSAAVQAVKIDQNGVFVNRSNIRLYELNFNISSYDYSSKDITQLVPELNRPGIVRMDCHRQPDTRIHCVRSDGIVNIAISDTAEDVLAWLQVESPGAGGLIEDVVCLPALAGKVDDQVYYVVSRVINGQVVRYLEKWAQEVDCRGDQALCFLADSYISQTFASPTTVIGNLSSLEGQQVVVWADGADVGTNDTVVPWTLIYTVTGGQITLAVAASNVVVGLPYSAPFQSTKLGQATSGSPLNHKKDISNLGIIACDIHRQGLYFGADFDVMDNMPLIERGRPVDEEVRVNYDESMIEFPGTWTTDSRICLLATAPRPVTLLAATYDMET